MMWGSQKGRWNRVWVASTLALALSAGSALAQNQSQNQTKNKSGDDFEKPLARAGGWGGGGSSMYFSQQDGAGRYELSVNGEGEMTAKVNGEEVPADRIKKSDGKVELLDKNGKTLATFNMSLGKVGRNAWGGGRGGSGRAWTMPAPEAPQVEWTPPKVMMGITMGEPGDELRKFLDLKDGEAVLVDRVVDGLPADKAGLRTQDVIVEFDGVKPITEGKIRDILRGKNAGDKIDAVVVRKGERKTVHIELQKYDAEKLGTAVAAPDADDGEPLRKLRDLSKLPPNIRENWNPKAWDEMMKEFEQAQREGGGAQIFRVLPDGKFQGFMAPQDTAKLEKLQAELAAKNAELARQMDLLTRKMDELQAKLDRLDQRRP